MPRELPDLILNVPLRSWTISGEVARESASRIRYCDCERRKSSKVHTIGHLLASEIISTNEQELELAAGLARHVQEDTGENVSVASIKHANIGEDATQNFEVVLVKLDIAKNGFALLLKRWGDDPFCV
jgi:hypothetical protein